MVYLKDNSNISYTSCTRFILITMVDIMQSQKPSLLLLLLVITVTYSIATKSVLAEPVAEMYHGLRLNAEFKQPSDKSLQDGVVLLIPSALGHHRMELIVNTQDLLTEFGVTTLAPSLSLRKQNRRWYIDCDDTIEYTAEDIFNEIDFWVAWLQKRGAKQITLLGHSLSANYVTLYMNQNRSDTIHNAILLAPATLAYGSQGVQRYESRFKVKLQDVLARAERYVTSGQGDTPMPEKTDYYFCPAASVTPNAFISLYKRMFAEDFPALWRKMPKPTLLIVGTGDNRSPEIEQVARNVKTEGVTSVVTIENGGHFFKGLYTEDVVQAMVAFLQQNSAD